jgi:hypothetical protein
LVKVKKVMFRVMREAAVRALGGQLEAGRPDDASRAGP